MKKKMLIRVMAMRTGSKSIDLISKKNKQNLHVQHTFFVHFSPLFCTATMPFCTTFNLYGEIVILELTHQKFCCLCVPVRFYFFTAAHFHLAGL